MLTNRMKKELATKGQTETKKYIYRLHENDFVQPPFVERLEKRFLEQTGYYTEWQRVPVTYGELMK